MFLFCVGVFDFVDVEDVERNWRGRAVEGGIDIDIQRLSLSQS